jgi:hypothetical protein
MAAALVLEFDDVDAAKYAAVNKALGIDMHTGKGDWPAGLLSHAGGTTGDSGFAVVEVWESKDAQAAFMNDRLGAALGSVGVGAPARITWVDLIAHHTA